MAKTDFKLDDEQVADRITAVRLALAGLREHSRHSVVEPRHIESIESLMVDFGTTRDE